PGRCPGLFYHAPLGLENSEIPPHLAPSSHLSMRIWGVCEFLRPPVTTNPGITITRSRHSRAPKGHYKTAQGIALGNKSAGRLALKGRYEGDNVLLTSAICWR